VDLAFRTAEESETTRKSRPDLGLVALVQLIRRGFDRPRLQRLVDQALNNPDAVNDFLSAVTSLKMEEGATREVRDHIITRAKAVQSKWAQEWTPDLEEWH
jgi:hypothetical protein